MKNSTGDKRVRVYRGGGPRPDRTEQKQKEAQDRQSAWSQLSEDEKRASKEDRGYRYAPEEGVK